jgi:hypothetical protein
MLSGELEPTSGSFTFSSGSSGRSETRMGYCPQNDALDPHLTVKEQLEVQCRLRGIPSNNISNVSQSYLKKLSLVIFASRLFVRAALERKFLQPPRKMFYAMIIKLRRNTNPEKCYINLINNTSIIIFMHFTFVLK